MRGVSILLTILVLFTGCQMQKKIVRQNAKTIIDSPPETWELKDCNEIINEYTTYNTLGSRENLITPGVKIGALPLNLRVINALVRKSAITRRLSRQDYLIQLNDYLNEFTNFYIGSDGELIKKTETDTLENSFTFKITFENISDPYKLFEVEGGFNCFFLENPAGKFSRVIDIYDEIDFNYFLIDGKTSLFVKFSTFSDEGKKLFLKDGYKLIFNGIFDKPIELEWEVGQEGILFPGDGTVK